MWTRGGERCVLRRVTFAELQDIREAAFSFCSLCERRHGLCALRNDPFQHCCCSDAHARALCPRPARSQLGDTPLHVACRMGNRAATAYLLMLGADVNARNRARALALTAPSGLLSPSGPCGCHCLVLGGMPHLLL